MDIRADAYHRLREWCAPLCLGADVPARVPSGPEDDCVVLDWASSGAMALTGFPDGPPSASVAPVIALLDEALGMLGRFAAHVGTPPRADPGLILAGRAGVRGLSRAGQTSAGGATRLLRTVDGWCAVTLARPSDLDALPAVLGADVTGDPWRALAVAATAPGAAEHLVAQCRLLGIPAAVLPQKPSPAAPFRIERIAAPNRAASLAGALVVDLSGMWAGPLCARLLGQAGARVVKVEHSGRPDGARRGDPRFFRWLHDGHEQISLDFHTAAGHAALAALLAEADVVIEASRPRALAQLGLAPADLAHPAGRVWLSITGYGRDEPNLTAFGDDAAVAGGLVAWQGREPVFCADAAADPLTGVCGALAVAGAVVGGGGVLIDLSMRAVAAAFASAVADFAEHGAHDVVRAAGQWRVRCRALGRERPVLPPPVAAC